MDSCFLSDPSFIPESIPYPCFLNDFQITSSAKLLYCLLLGTVLTSGEEDENGHLFICCSIEHLTIHFCRSISTLKRLLRELEDMGLLKRNRQKIGAPSRLYPLFPEYVCRSVAEQTSFSAIASGKPSVPSIQEFPAAQGL